jgi:serine/threonine protein kinase
MEQGVSVTYVTPQIKRELMENLSLMHSVRLIHNDVKPENIMYSHQLKKYVFIDFGISEFIYETLGKMSIVVFRGSYNYCLA